MTTRALSGILAAAVVLGIGQLVSVPIGPASSPFFAVGSTTVDRSPAWAREFAITTFGTNDKPALFVGMTVLIVVLAAVAGMVERPRRPYGSAILLVLGLVGVYAAVNRPGATASYALPTIVGVAAGIVTLRCYHACAGATGSGNGAPGMARRRFLVLAATAAAVAAAPGGNGTYLADRVAGRGP
ncbi:hypothetical protein GS461_06805 [Rhodococcus hoagii]|nr:hypothetical protein [Prescottella equi]